MSTAAPERDIDDLNYEFLKALMSHEWDQAKALIGEGADINHATNLRKDSPLILAVNRPDLDVMRWLLANGADGTLRNNEGMTPVHMAINLENAKKGEELFDALIDAGAPFDAPDSLGVRPLSMAIGLRGREAMALKLLDLGADINLPSHMGATPLMVALTFGRAATVKRLLELGADPTPSNLDGKNAMHAAAEGADPELGELFVTSLDPAVAKVLLDHKNLAGSTPLAMSVGYGHVEIIKAMIEAGADVNARAGSSAMENVTCLMMLTTLHAREHSYDLAEVSTKLQKQVEAKEITQAKMQEILGKMINRRQILEDALPLAIDHGADFSHRDVFGGNALNYTQGNMETLRVLMESGRANPLEPISARGTSPLLFKMQEPDRAPSGTDERAQAQRAKVEATAADIRQIVAWGFPLEPQAAIGVAKEKEDGEGPALYPSPLGLALRLHRFGHAKLLLELGAQVNAWGPDKKPALHHLAEAGLMGQNDKAALQMLGRKAQSMGNKEALEKLKKQATDLKADRLTELMGALDLLDRAGIQWNAVSDQGETALAMAAGMGNNEIITALINKGADPLHREGEGRSALMVALVSGQPDTFQLLIERLRLDGRLEEAKTFLGDAILSSPEQSEARHNFKNILATFAGSPWVDAADADGNTPLILAAATAQSDMVELLLSMGADPTPVNQAGESALLHAVAQEDVDAIIHLRDAGAPQEVVNHEGQSIRDLARDTPAIARLLEPVALEEQTRPPARELPGTMGTWRDERASWWVKPEAPRALPKMF